MNVKQLAITIFNLDIDKMQTLPITIKTMDLLKKNFNLILKLLFFENNLTHDDLIGLTGKIIYTHYINYPSPFLTPPIRKLSTFKLLEPHKQFSNCQACW